MLENIKMLLDIYDSSKDNILNYHINSVERKILDYCNLNELPDGLNYLVEEIVVDIYESKYNTSNNVESIKTGDTTTEFGREKYNSTTGAGGANFIKNYTKQLERYRRGVFI